MVAPRCVIVNAELRAVSTFTDPRVIEPPAPADAVIVNVSIANEPAIVCAAVIV